MCTGEWLYITLLTWACVFVRGRSLNWLAVGLTKTALWSVLTILLNTETDWNKSGLLVKNLSSVTEPRVFTSTNCDNPQSDSSLAQFSLLRGVACYAVMFLEKPDIESMWLLYRQSRMPQLPSHILTGVVYHPRDALSRTTYSWSHCWYHWYNSTHASAFRSGCAGRFQPAKR